MLAALRGASAARPALLARRARERTRRGGDQTCSRSRSPPRAATPGGKGGARGRMSGTPRTSRPPCFAARWCTRCAPPSPPSRAPWTSPSAAAAATAAVTVAEAARRPYGGCLPRRRGGRPARRRRRGGGGAPQPKDVHAAAPRARILAAAEDLVDVAAILRRRHGPRRGRAARRRDRARASKLRGGPLRQLAALASVGPETWDRALYPRRRNDDPRVAAWRGGELERRRADAGVGAAHVERLAASRVVERVPAGDGPAHDMWSWRAAAWSRRRAGGARARARRSRRRPRPARTDGRAAARPCHRRRRLARAALRAGRTEARARRRRAPAARARARALHLNG